MNDETLLAMLKIDLGIPSTAYDERLESIIEAAKAAIKKEGASTLNTADSIQDAQLVIMYSGWLWRRRDTMEAMPRMVRWALNNRIFGEKAGAAV